MIQNNNDIFLLSTNNWNGFWFQRQEYAKRFAKEGNRVFYINKLPQRIPSIQSIVRYFKTNKQNNNIVNPVPENVYILKLVVFPPLIFFNFINYIILHFYLSSIINKFKIKNCIFITYQPTKTVLNIISILKPSKIIYVNTHNYNADPSCPKSLFKSENILVSKAHCLLADSKYNVNRIKNYNASVKVGRAMPGVDTSLFSKAYRGDEYLRKENIFFFGDIGKHLEIDLYNQAAEDFKVYLIGIVNPSIIDKLSKKITLLPPASPAILPEILYNADIITIWYKPSDYVNGVLPAKFFECLATKKPFFVSGLQEASPYLDAVYNINGSYLQFKNIISTLSNTETDFIRQKRVNYALEADWSERFNQFKQQIGI